MLHVSLHWSEYCVNDLALWLFAVKHATWLYNQIPSRTTGFTPFELLTKTHVDHHNLLQTGVWGCPTFVLDPKLQNGQKILKWNQHAYMGQMITHLCWQSEISGPVMLVLNIMLSLMTSFKPF